MRGDVMYCLHCKRFFFDIHNVVDTRVDKMFNDMCGFCLSTRTVNATVRVLHDDEPFRVITREIIGMLNKDKGMKVCIDEQIKHVEEG